MKVIVDTSVISVFSEIGRIRLLFSILSDLEITLPPHVVEEIMNGYKQGYDFYTKFISLIQPEEEGNVDSPLIHIVNVNNERVLRFSKENGLGYGESSVIVACMDDVKYSVGVIDDDKARKVAKTNGVSFTGTIGLIKRGFELCKIEVKSVLMDILNDINKTGFHTEPWLFQYVMESEKEKGQK